MKIKVFNLELLDSHYYIKRSTIVEKIIFNNRTFYAKFEHIDEPLTPILLEQHLHKQYTIAVPLLKENLTNYLVLEYNGDEYKRFYHLVKYLFITLKIEDYYIYEGKDESRVQVFVEVDAISLQEADIRVQYISNALKQKLTKKWKCLPSILLPNEYNIITLPYKVIE